MVRRGGGKVEWEELVVKITLINADVLEGLRTLPDESIHMVCTSPPYWGLRDYGVPGQLGLEKTPEEYIEKMVAVFREVRRVLRKDGTCWINLGSSYAGSGMQSSNPGGKTKKQMTNQGSFSVGHGKQTNQFHGDAPACDSDGKELEDSIKPDCVYPYPDDVFQGDSQNHHGRNARTSVLPAQSVGPLWLIGRDNEREDFSSITPDAVPPVSPESTMPGFWLRLRDGCLHLDNPFSCPSFSAACFPGVLGYANKKVFPCEIQITSDAKMGLEENIPGTGGTGGALVCRTKDKVSGSYALSKPPIVEAYHNIKWKAKDLLLIPSMLALALVQDGWWLRSDIIWAKPNPMPESCTDRPTTSHEHIFLLTKSAKYFYDAEAVREESFQEKPRERGRPNGLPTWDKCGCNSSCGINPAGRNLRSVWTLATEPFPEAHFATFPTSIPERCIKAGTSEKGVCPKCGAPWKRVVRKDTPKQYLGKELRWGNQEGNANRMPEKFNTNSYTVGWENTCAHGISHLLNESCTVLDPFSGAATTLMVAAKLGRDAIGIELNPEYVAMSVKRLKQELGMLCELEVVPCATRFTITNQR